MSRAQFISSPAESASESFSQAAPVLTPDTSASPEQLSVNPADALIWLRNQTALNLLMLPQNALSYSMNLNLIKAANFLLMQQGTFLAQQVLPVPSLVEDKAQPSFIAPFQNSSLVEAPIVAAVDEKKTEAPVAINLFPAGKGPGKKHQREDKKASLKSKPKKKIRFFTFSNPDGSLIKLDTPKEQTPTKEL